MIYVNRSSFWICVVFMHRCIKHNGDIGRSWKQLSGQIPTRWSMNVPLVKNMFWHTSLQFYMWVKCQHVYLDCKRLRKQGSWKKYILISLQNVTVHCVIQNVILHCLNLNLVLMTNVFNGIVIMFLGLPQSFWIIVNNIDIHTPEYIIQSKWSKLNICRSRQIMEIRTWSFASPNLPI